MATKTIRVETVAQAYLELLRDRGIDCFFGNAGTDFASILDALARFRAEGKASPRPILVPHEYVAVSMAHGYYAMTGRPQVVMVHVSVGTANAVGAIINAARSQVPILFTAGRTPLTEEGLPGSRDIYIHWAQEAFDQAGMVREFVKWDYELRNATQLEAVVDRALELAMADPRGPVYLTLPREVLAQPVEAITITSPPRRGAAGRRYPDPTRLAEAAELLAGARFPLVVTSSAGRDPAAVGALRALAEAGGIGVTETNPFYMNFPHDHPCHLGFGLPFEGNPAVAEADVLLVLDSDVPWYPSIQKPREEARVIHLAVDPHFSRYPIRSYPSDVVLAADPAVALGLLAEAVGKRVRPATAASRTERFAAEHRAQRQVWLAAARAEAEQRPIGFQWASRCVGEVLDRETIVVNEYPLDLRHAPLAEPGSYLASPPSSGLGWGFGAALGAKLGAPGKTVIATLGDGAYLFSVPTACHFAARMHELPVLTVVFNNESWDAVKSACLGLHPDGWAATTRHIPLSDLAPAPRYEEIVRAFDGYGERVEEPAELVPALRRALHAVREERRQALLNVVCRR